MNECYQKLQPRYYLIRIRQYDERKRDVKCLDDITENSRDVSPDAFSVMTFLSSYLEEIRDEIYATVDERGRPIYFFKFSGNKQTPFNKLERSFEILRADDVYVPWSFEKTAKSAIRFYKYQRDDSEGVNE